MGAAREDVDGGWCVCVSQGRVEEAKGPVGNSRMMARKCKLREKVLLQEANEKGEWERRPGWAPWGSFSSLLENTLQFKIGTRVHQARPPWSSQPRAEGRTPET